MRILITGSNGFIGRNLVERLSFMGYELVFFTRSSSSQELTKLLNGVDFIFHLAGVNRPIVDSEFIPGNHELTKKLIEAIEESGREIPVLFSSSTQAESENTYGQSKKMAEQELLDFSMRSGNPVYIYRLCNVFGKWSKPNYNSVVATFCHNVANGIDCVVHDAKSKVRLVYIDDVVKEFCELLKLSTFEKVEVKYVNPSYEVSVVELLRDIQNFSKIHETNKVPDLTNHFIKKLYSTYLSFVDEKELSYGLVERADERGVLFEALKSEAFGQIFISKTNPGYIRGNHYHNTKVEKFCVIEGDAEVLLRDINSNKIIKYSLSGSSPEVLDIPPGMTHSIQNIGEDVLITMFWANEEFDQEKPDTYFLEVKNG
ncbi:hypothetical protein BIY24_01810 [Halobacteriovorax marinus]|uniref:polysaccharide biosynthesis C-terminal domain-containing protein n=1 Tax=Halobacteriovorax marinus TaxID=97084 RepID=UPI000BC32F33|nr:NAD-dependent epimerase/dehydratase family protein [Halobacteriovorax marinus]ATH06717.1 hypothetical protein BIY24_01810 [Halobacteriovorax marinus]